MCISVKFGHQQRNTTTDPKETHMKTAFTSNKDNVAISSILAVSLFALASGLFSSNAAIASQAVAVQKLDTIVVTASRSPDAVLDTMVVTASRKAQRV